MDYSKLSEITVKTQEELDAIPDDFKGQIYIEGGTPFARIYVKKKYYYRVVARGNSSVEANANVQIVDMLQGSKIKISGNARIVYMPKNIFDFMNFYGIKHTKTKAIFYKAVNKYDDGTYHSNYDSEFIYGIGKYATEECDSDAKESCGRGLHISHLNWALNFGCNWDTLAILEVETKISDIILPDDSDGKVRTSKLKVIREVPLEECGLYGKILARRRANENKPR